MKKIMFNDRYGLTQAVIEGRKTMERKGIRLADYDVEYLDTAFDWDLRESVIIDRYAQYKVGEIIAVAQSYEDVFLNNQHWLENELAASEMYVEYLHDEAGWRNKASVKANLMPHQIRITGIKVERMKDISEEDCMKEGVYYDEELDGYKVTNLSLPNKGFRGDLLRQKYFFTPREAFAALIDKVSVKGTWASNPYVFVYSFKLVR